jgi:hypothetical protein
MYLLVPLVRLLTRVLNHLPLSELKISHRIRPLHVVASAVDGADARGRCPSCFAVGLIDCVMSYAMASL